MRICWILLLSVAACSPYSFPKEVSAISTGVDQLSSGFTDGYTALAADRATQLDLDLTASRAKVAISNSCYAPSPTMSEYSKPCQLFKSGAAEPKPMAIELQREKTMAALGVLKDYAHALAAVTSAADRAAYDAAVAQLSAAVGALAKNADTMAPGASTVAPAAVNVVGWVFGAALDEQRFDTLKAGVTAAGAPSVDGESPISRVARTLGVGLVALSQARQTVLLENVQVLQGRLQPSLSDAAYRQGLTDAKADIAVLDGLRRSNPTAAADALVKAHDALLAAVNDPERNYPSLVTAVSDFSAKATALQAALAATATATKK